MHRQIAVLVIICSVAAGNYAPAPAPVYVPPPPVVAAPPLPAPVVPGLPLPPPPDCCRIAAGKVAHLENKVDDLDDDRKELQRSYNRLNDLVIVLTKRQYNDYRRLRSLLDRVNKTLTDDKEKYCGPKGKHGARGIAGPPGNEGAPGKYGHDGKDGIDLIGKPGSDGHNGQPGKVGEDGPPGPQGASSAMAGAPGQNGLQGPAGEQGASGPKGAIGPQGPPGLCGTPGAPGRDITCSNEDYRRCQPQPPTPPIDDTTDRPPAVLCPGSGCPNEPLTNEDGDFDDLNNRPPAVNPADDDGTFFF